MRERREKHDKGRKVSRKEKKNYVERKKWIEGMREKGLRKEEKKNI